MARVYQPKKITTKLLEGAGAGLVGGLAFVLVLMVADAVMRSGDLLYTVSLLGTIVTGGTVDGSTGLGTPFLVGAILLIALFTLMGVGFVSYLPVVFRLGIHKALFGAIYGLLIWLAIFFLMLGFINQSVSKSANIWVLLVGCIVAGATTGWALDMLMSVMSRKGDTSYGQSRSG